MRNILLLLILCFTIALSKKAAPSSSKTHAPTKTAEEKDFDEGKEEDTEIVTHNTTQSASPSGGTPNNTTVDDSKTNKGSVDDDKITDPEEKESSSSSIWDSMKNVLGSSSKEEAPLGSLKDGNEEEEETQKNTKDDNITIVDEVITPDEDAKEKSLFSKLIGGDDDGDDNGATNATSPVIHGNEEGNDDVLQKPSDNEELDDQYEEQLEPGTMADVDDKELTEQEQKEEEAEDEEEDEEKQEEEEMGMMPIIQTKEDILKAEQQEAIEEKDDDLGNFNITKFDSEEMDDAEYSDTDDEDVREVTDDVDLQEAKKEEQGSTSIFGGHASPAAQEGEGTYQVGGNEITTAGAIARDWAIVGTVVSSVLLAAGSLMQKVSSYDQSSALNIPAIAGSVLVLVGVILNAITCGFLPLTTIAILNAQTVVAAHIIESLFMGVGFDVITAASIVLTTIGVVISVIASNQVDPEYTPADLSARMFHPGAIVNTVFFTVLIVVCLYGCPRVVKRSISGTDMTFIGEVIAGAITAAMYTLLLKLVLEIIIYGSTYGSESLRPEAGFITLCIILIAVLAIVKVRIVSSSLKQYHVVLYTPIYQALSILLTAIFGVTYLDEFGANRIAVADGSVVLYIVGIVLVLLGVGISSTKFDPYVHVVDDDGDDGVEKESLMEEGDHDPKFERYQSRDPTQGFRPISEGV